MLHCIAVLSFYQNLQKYVTLKKYIIFRNTICGRIYITQCHYFSIIYDHGKSLKSGTLKFCFL